MSICEHLFADGPALIPTRMPSPMSRGQYRHRQQQQRGSCRFCGRNSVTDEHIIPQSWGSLLDGGLGDIPGQTLWFVHSTYEPVADGPRATLLHEKRAKQPAYKSRHFCQPCQGGWMRELDEEVRDLMFALAPASAATISADQQRLIAAWAVKTMLVYMTKESPMRQQEYGVSSVYRAFGAVREPLQGMQLWIGAHSENSAGWFRPHSATWHTPHGEQRAGFGAILILAHVVLLLLANVPAEWRARLRYEPAIALKQISPLVTPCLPWPPRLRFAKQNLTELIESLPGNLTLVPAQ